MAGRPKREGEIVEVLLRLPPALLARVERCMALLQLSTGIRRTRTAVFEHVLALGCAQVEAVTQSPVPVLQVSQTTEIFQISEILKSLEVSQVPQRRETEPTRQPTPAPPETRQPSLTPDILRVAEVAAQYPRLSLADLAQLLFDRDIYRATDKKTGEKKPINRGTLTRWLHTARMAGEL